MFGAFLLGALKFGNHSLYFYGSKSWIPLQPNIPKVPIKDILTPSRAHRRLDHRHRELSRAAPCATSQERTVARIAAIAYTDANIGICWVRSKRRSNTALVNKMYLWTIQTNRSVVCIISQIRSCLSRGFILWKNFDFYNWIELVNSVQHTESTNI